MDLEYQVKGMEGLLPLELAVVYAEKRASGLHCELEPLAVKDAARAEVLYALSAKLLPLVVYLRAVVPEFRDALADEIITTVQPERDYRVELDSLRQLVRETEYDRGVVMERERAYKSEIGRLNLEVHRWRKQERESERPMVVLGSRSLELEREMSRERDYQK